MAPVVLAVFGEADSRCSERVGQVRMMDGQEGACRWMLRPAPRILHVSYRAE